MHLPKYLLVNAVALLNRRGLLLAPKTSYYMELLHTNLFFKSITWPLTSSRYLGSKSRFTFLTCNRVPVFDPGAPLTNFPALVQRHLRMKFVACSVKRLPSIYPAPMHHVMAGVLASVESSMEGVLRSLLLRHIWTVRRWYNQSPLR